MIIESIKFSNWRCFYGEVEIVFSNDKIKNVTLIHGQNGFGKTNILNGFYWTFFNTTSGKFKDPELIINDQAKKDGINRAFVEVNFRQGDTEYRAVRYYSTLSISQDPFKLFTIDNDGNQVPVSNPDTVIKNILHPDMAKYFLFDGEANEFTKGSNNIKEAIKTIIGITPIEKAIADLGTLLKDTDKEIKSYSNNDDLKSFMNEKELLENSFKKIKGQIQDAEEDKNTQIIVRNSLRIKLSEYEISKTIQNSINNNRSHLKSLKANKDKLVIEEKGWVQKYGNSLLSKDLCKKINSMINIAKKNYKIPGKYSKPLIEELIKNKKCICGRAFDQHSKEEKTLLNKLGDSGDSLQIDRTNKLTAAFKELAEKRDKAEDNLKKLIQDKDAINSQIKNIETTINEEEEKIKKIDNDEIQKSKEKEKEAEKQISGLDQMIGKLKNNQVDLPEEISNLDKAVEKIQKEEKSNAKLVYKKDFIKKAIDKLTIMLNENLKDAKGIINSAVNISLKKIAHKDIQIKLSDDFSFQTKYSGVDLPESGGEDQLINLLFTASLVKFSKLRENAKSVKDNAGIVAPLILDAPFSKLDNDYATSISKIIPEFGSQVVLILSGKDASKEVIDTLNNKIGKEYLLLRYNKEKGDDKHIRIRDKKYVNIFFGKDIESSFIQDISNE